MMMMMKTKT